MFLVPILLCKNNCIFFEFMIFNFSFRHLANMVWTRLLFFLYFFAVILQMYEYLLIIISLPIVNSCAVIKWPASILFIYFLILFYLFNSDFFRLKLISKVKTFLKLITTVYSMSQRCRIGKDAKYGVPRISPLVYNKLQ